MTDEVSVTQAWLYRTTVPADSNKPFFERRWETRVSRYKPDDSVAWIRDVRPLVLRDPLAKPLLTLVGLTREYLPSDGISKDEFINRVLGVLDNDEMAELVGELEGRR